MTKNKILEKLDSKFPSPHDNSQDVLIYKNPSNLEMQSVKSKTDYDELRGLINVNSVYIWDANLATHTEVEQFLNISSTNRFLILADGSILNADERPFPNLNEVPLLKRMLQKYNSF